MCCSTLSKIRSCAFGSFAGCCALVEIQPPTTVYKVSVADSRIRMNLVRNDIYLPLGLRYRRSAKIAVLRTETYDTGSMNQHQALSKLAGPILALDLGEK